MKLETNRQQLEDLSKYFLPYMLKVAESKIYDAEVNDQKLLHKVCKSVLSDIDIIFKRKLLTSQKKFGIRLKDAEGIIFYEFLFNFPIQATDLWRWTKRQQLIDQLDQQM